MLMLLLSGVSAKLAYRTLFSHNLETKTIWLNNYKDALAQAIKQSKPLFIDIESSICAACKSVDKKVFKQSEVIE